MIAMPQTTDAMIGGRILHASSAASTAGPPAASSADGDDDLDFDECRACYGVAVACVSLVLFCVLAASVGITKACAVSCLAVVLFGVIGWFVPFRDAPRGGGATGARRADDGAAAPRRLGCACGLAGAVAIDVPPSFAYECPAEGGVHCAVCLEDVRRGEAVRQVPACRHLFHKECIDMWLQSHTTCPLCRCQLLPRKLAAKAKMAAVAESSADALPPV